MNTQLYYIYALETGQVAISIGKFGTSGPSAM